MQPSVFFFYKAHNKYQRKQMREEEQEFTENCKF